MLSKLSKVFFHAASTFIVLFCVVLPSYAQQAKPYLHITQAPLHKSLTELANTFNVSFSCDPQLLDNQTGAAIRGTYSLPQALTLLLKNSDLTYTIQHNGFVISAQPKPITPSQIEEITVKGIRYSLARSKGLKQNAKTISDAISAQDITEIPNTNLAEALQYIPGVAITREAGEGRQVSIRGSFPDFSLVTLNGMPVLANNDSPMDSRIQKQRDRSFDFNILPAELFKHVQINKAYSADQIAGGVSGTMALQTINPLDNKDFAFIYSQEIGYNNYVGGGASRYSGLISNNWGDWGALASVAYTTRESLEQGANTFRWRNIAITEADLSALTPLAAQQLMQGDYIIPRGNRYSVWQSSQQRFGTNLSVEYKDDNSHIDLDILWGYLQGNRFESHLYPRGDKSTPIINNLTAITEIQANADNELVYAQYQDARVATESRAQAIATTYDQVILSLSRQLTPKWLMKALIGKEKSQYDIPYSNKVYTQGISDVSIDYRNSPFYADIDYSEDLQNPALWQLNHGDIESYNSSSAYTFSKLDFNYQLTTHTHFNWGVDWTQFQNNMYNPQQNDIFFDDISQNNPLTGLPHTLIKQQNNHKKQQWLTLDTNKILALYGIDPFNSKNNHYAISSEAEYIKENGRGFYGLFSTEHTQWHNQVGIRYQSDRITSYSQAPTQPIAYHLWLPSFNSTYFINQNWRLRAGLAKNYAKPLLDLLRVADANENQINTRYIFNPQLKPYIAYNSDISLEGELSTRSDLNIALFYKNLKNYIVTTPATNELTTESQQTLLWYSNAETAYQWGTEVSFNHLFKNSYWGINLQAAYNKGEVRYYNSQNGTALFKKDLPYLSKITASGMIFYDHPKLNFKLGAIFRDKYIVRAGTLLIDENETGFMPTTYWDASLNYFFSPHWKLTLSAFNLSNEQERQYSHSTLRAYNTTTSGRTFYLGLSYQY